MKSCEISFENLLTNLSKEQQILNYQNNSRFCSIAYILICHQLWKFVNETFVIDSEFYDIEYPEYVIENSSVVQIELSQLAGIYMDHINYVVQLDKVTGEQ